MAFSIIKKCARVLLCVEILLILPILGNPFLADFPEKEELTNEDYIILQERLRAIDINPLLHKYYKENRGTLSRSYETFYSRCSRGIHQTFIDPDKDLFPIKELIKINEGGDVCVVSSVPCSKQYPRLLQEQTIALEKVGFNGYHLRFVGAFPNPTGKEIRYAGVPYCFKIFAMLEAEKLGFNKVLWLDSSLQPLQDIAELFDRIDEVGFLAIRNPSLSSSVTHTFLETKSLLQDLTGVDVFSVPRVVALVIGLKMDHSLTKRFIQQYYQFVTLGYPFISGWPEEMVYTAILHQEEFADWMDDETDFYWWFPFFFEYQHHEWPDRMNCRLPG